MQPESGSEQYSASLMAADKAFELFDFALASKSYELALKMVGESKEHSAERMHCLTRLTECYARTNQPDEVRRTILAMRALEEPLVEKRKHLIELLTLGASHENEQNYEDGAAVYLEALGYAKQFLQPTDPIINSLEKACSSMQKNMHTMTLSRTQPLKIDLGLRSANIDGKKLMAVQLNVEKDADFGEEAINKGDFAAAAQHYQDAVALLVEAPFPNREKMKHCLNKLLAVYTKLNEPDKILAVMEEKDAIDPLNIQSRQAIETLSGAANVFAKNRRYDDAGSVYMRAIRMASFVLPSDDSLANELNDAYVDLYKGSGVIP